MNKEELQKGIDLFAAFGFRVDVDLHSVYLGDKKMYGFSNARSFLSVDSVTKTIRNYYIDQGMHMGKMALRREIKSLLDI